MSALGTTPAAAPLPFCRPTLLKCRDDCPDLIQRSLRQPAQPPRALGAGGQLCPGLSGGGADRLVATGLGALVLHPQGRTDPDTSRHVPRPQPTERQAPQPPPAPPPPRPK